MAAGDIAAAMPDVTFGAVSLQLRALHEAGLVRRADQKNRDLQPNARLSDLSADRSSACGTTRCGG